MTEPEQSRQTIAKWLRLHLTDRIGSITFQKLLKKFGGIDQILNATASELAGVPGIGPKIAEQIAQSRDTIDVEDEMALAETLGVEIVTIESQLYPPLLRQLHDPPCVLYIKGEILREDNLAVAIVGSRNCSHYGQEQAAKLGHMLAAAGFTIVSGLARGIDTAAHRGAIAAEGRTIAVQGRGLADVFPPENSQLAEQIAENGAVISELPLRYEPISNTFPARNRIISGLSLGTIVVEAGRRSGALITAQLAVEQNRQVMAVPGRIDSPGSTGPHWLIKDGAALVTNIEDVLEAIGQIGQIIKDHAASAAQQARQTVETELFEQPEIKLTDIERDVFGVLAQEPAHMEDIIARSNRSPGSVSASVISLQLKGLVKQLPGNYYKKKNAAAY